MLKQEARFGKKVLRWAARESWVAMKSRRRLGGKEREVGSKGDDLVTFVSLQAEGAAYIVRTSTVIMKRGIKRERFPHTISVIKIPCRLRIKAGCHVSTLHPGPRAPPPQMAVVLSTCKSLVCLTGQSIVTSLLDIQSHIGHSRT